MLHRSVSGLVVVALLGGLAGALQAGIIAQHLGASDPLTEGFTTPNAGGSISDEAEPSWRIVGPASSLNRYRFATLETDWRDPAGWTGTVRVKAVGSADWDSEGLPRVGAEFRTDTHLWAIKVSAGDGALTKGLYNAAADTFGPVLISAAVDPTDGFHTYQIYYNPAIDSGEYYIDGTWVGTVPSSLVPALNLNELQWGASTSAGGEGNASYSIVQLETGKNIVPEPVSIVTLLAGLAATTLRPRRRA
ncbi:MAG: hypothetical protein KA354_02735 [Phycisphaerae bacterium]|nr:hypothetical protein [Phycisphaerae bacterium]